MKIWQAQVADLAIVKMDLSAVLVDLAQKSKACCTRRVVRDEPRLYLTSEADKR